MDKIEKYLANKDLVCTISTKFTKETPAHYCCKNGHKDILKKTLIKCPDVVHKVDDEGNTLLHSLCKVRISIIVNES